MTARASDADTPGVADRACTFDGEVNNNFKRLADLTFKDCSML